MAGQLRDKVAVVTGGASGIGRASAVRFAAEGARIVIGDLDAPRGEATTTAIRANGGSAIFVRTDTTSEADCAALADAAMQEFSRLDVCVAAAGISSATYVSGQESPRVEMLTTDESHVRSRTHAACRHQPVAGCSISSLAQSSAASPSADIHHSSPPVLSPAPMNHFDWAGWRILLGEDPEHGLAGFASRSGVMNGIQQIPSWPYVKTPTNAFEFAHASHLSTEGWLDVNDPDFPA